MRLILFISFCIVFPLRGLTQHADTTILEGRLNRADLEQYSWFKKNYNDYKPLMSAVDELAEHKKCSLLIVMGTWCSDSHEMIPQLFKVADLAGWEQIEIIGVNRKKQCSSIDIRPLEIEYVPVIFLFENKKAMGKIVETTAVSVEEDLLKLLSLHKQ